MRIIGTCDLTNLAHSDVNVQNPREDAVARMAILAQHAFLMQRKRKSPRYAARSRI